MRSYNGAPLPPGFNILELEIPELKNQDIDGVMMIGMGSWGVGALNNYILAKQMWNANVNVRDIYEEWLQLTYGPGWEAIDKMYALIESAVSKRKQDEDPEYSGDKYEVNRDFIEVIYLPLLSQIEKLYLSALSRTEAEPQTKRLQMLGDNLFVLYHDMKEAGMLKNPEGSYFYLPDEKCESFLQEQRSSLSLYSQGNLIYVCPIWEGEWGHNICEYLEVIGE